MWAPVKAAAVAHVQDEHDDGQDPQLIGDQQHAGGHRAGHDRTHGPRPPPDQERRGDRNGVVIRTTVQAWVICRPVS
jgi:hypothetical protein